MELGEPLPAACAHRRSRGGRREATGPFGHAGFSSYPIELVGVEAVMWGDTSPQARRNTTKPPHAVWHHRIMADLRFTRERSQLRGLGILTALVLAGVGGFAQGLVGIIVLGTGALVCLYAFTAYLLAVTECTPAGIRTRGLAGPRRCSWSQVTDISLRYGRRSVRITVTTAHEIGRAHV